MKDSIGLKIPLNYSALIRAAEMLTAMANDLPRVFADDKPAPIEDDTPPPIAEHIVETPDTSAHAAGTPGAATSASDAFSTEGDPLDEDVPPLAPAGVKLDSDGLPWDVRIHSSSKKKLVKTQKWKKARGVHDSVVEKVEAELRAAMAATDDTPPPPADDDTPPPPAEDDTPPPPAETGITNMGQLMGAITAAGKTAAEVQAAAVKQGLASIALLGARPDLIPNVVAELGL